MYETMSYEVILKRMLDRVPGGLDKREGSFLYTALTAAAAEMQIMYIEFDTILKETFADTASRENLIRRAAERGMTPRPASKAVLKAQAVPDHAEIPIGERFRLGQYLYVVCENLGEGCYRMECETEGSCGNRQLGRLVPVLSLPGLASMELTEVLIPGEDMEETELFRKEYFQSFHAKAFGGNRKDYMDKVNGIAGVGATKITRTWNGPSTVRLTILDSGFGKASESLVQMVQETMDPGAEGNGEGLAPIDHVVTVDTVEEVEIFINSRISFDNGYRFEDLQEPIKEALERYFKELRISWEGLGEQGCIVRIARIESGILAVQGVTDVESTTVNGLSQNMELSPYQVPVYGGVENDS